MANRMREIFANEHIINRAMDHVETKRFDLNACYSNLLKEYYHVFKKPLPKKEKKFILSLKKFLSKDEQLVFIAIVRNFLENKIVCPKCKSSNGFVSGRYKIIAKMLKIEKFVRQETPRTLSCCDCSFVFHPLALTFYGHTNLDLRTWFFYGIITNDGKLDLPITSISKILNVSYGTAKNMKECVFNHKRKSDKWIEESVNSLPEEHYITDIYVQMFDLNYQVVNGKAEKLR